MFWADWIAIVVSFVLLNSPLTARKDYHPCQGRIVPSAPSKPRLGDSVNNSYAGIVTAVTKNTITIRWVNSPNEEQKIFAVSETLAAGDAPVEPRTLPGQAVASNKVMLEYMYRLTDVRAGDCVGIFYARIDGVDICDHIRISRRPGGEVPPLPPEAERLRDPREVWKAKNPGKPLPDDLANRHYLPYHEWVNALWAKVAPMPREAKPKP